MPFRIPFWDKFPVEVVLLQKRGNAVTGIKDKGRYVIKDGTRIYELKKYGIKIQPTNYENIIPLDNGKPLVFLYEYARGMVVPISTDNMQTLYVYADNKVVTEKIAWVCENDHGFNKPEEKTKGKLKKTTVKICPFCKTETIGELEEPKTMPKVDKVVNLHVVPEDMRFWEQNRIMKAQERHKSDGWLARNSQVVMSGMVFVFFIILVYFFSNALSENTNDIVTAMRDLANSGAMRPPG